jgi:DNA-binding Lrp family transcriptional regulator
MAEQRGELWMSATDRERLKVLHEVKKRHITQVQAGRELGVSSRWVRALLKRMKERGDGGLVHGLRGRRSNRRLPAALKRQVVGLFAKNKQAKQWHDYGPTLAAEELASDYQLVVSKETLRKWLIEAKLWRPQRARVERIHRWRARRARWGELVQWDTSQHDWLEGRGEKMWLIAMIDDATSQVLARFVEHDSTEENLKLLRSYVQRHGRPLAVYTDKASLFQTAPKAVHHRQAPEQQPTQIGRALAELGIEWIAAHSPQAKGRIERFFGTAQDRLVKGLRKHQVTTREQANRYLEEIYHPLWNRRFAQEPRQAGSAHRVLDPGTDLDSVLSVMELRTVAQDYTLRWGGQVYQIPRADIGGGMRGASVALERRLDGSVWMRWRQQRVRLERCEAANKPNYRLRWIPPQAAAKPDAAERQRRRQQARLHYAEAFRRLPDRPLWRILQNPNS